MNLSETIKSMLDKGVAEILIAQSPERVPYILVKHQVRTGPSEGDLTVVTHQAEGENLGECFNRVAKNMEAIKSIEHESRILRVQTP